MFVDVGRGLGALLVVYTHFDALFLRENHGQTVWLAATIDNVFAGPMRLDDQGAGLVAVVFFFLASGFVVTQIAMRLGSGRFAINRFFRIYPLLIAVVVLAAVLVAFGLRPLTTGPVTDVNAGKVLGNIALINFMDKPLAAFVGVTWTLLVEVLFYLMIVALLPVFRRSIWFAIAVELEIVTLVLITHGQLDETYRAFAVNIAYVLMPIAGQVIWAAWHKKIPTWLAGSYLVICWCLFVWAAKLTIDPNYAPRPFPFAVAIVVFLLGLFAERHLRERKVWTVLSERTYSIYLLHGVAGFPVMAVLYDHVPVWLTLLAGVAATALSVELAYRLIERPSHEWGRRLSRAKKPLPERVSRPAAKPAPAARPRPRPAPAPAPVEETTVLPAVERTVRIPVLRLELAARRNGRVEAASSKPRTNGVPPRVNGKPRHAKRTGNRQVPMWPTRDKDD